MCLSGDRRKKRFLIISAPTPIPLDMTSHDICARVCVKGLKTWTAEDEYIPSVPSTPQKLFEKSLTQSVTIY